jgi:hypothetical protein
MTVSDQHPPSSPSTGRRRRTRDLVLHYLATVVAMAVGVVALHPLWDLVLDAFGAGTVLDRPEPMALVMATDMVLGATLVLRWRRHSWRACAGLGAAIYPPFVVLFGPLWVGLLPPGRMVLWGLVLALVAVAGAMALRPSEYARG